MDVPELLRKARERAGLSQRDLARLAGVGRSVITDCETERHSPSVRTLDRLLAGCGLQARVTLEPLLAEVDERVDALVAGPEPLDAEQLERLRRLAGSLDALPGSEVGRLGRASLRKGPVGWAFDGETALRLHGFAADPDPLSLVVRLDEAARYWMRAVQLQGVEPRRGDAYMSWLDGELDEMAEALQGSCFSLVGFLRVRLVEVLPTAVALVPHGGSRGLPTVGLDEVERAHPALGEVLARLRDRRSLAS